MRSFTLIDEVLSSWILLGLVLIACYIISSAVWNIYFSPLTKIPGPFLAKITSWVSFYYALTGYRHIWIWQCHQIYGPIFRFFPNGVLVNSDTGFRAIYSGKANVKRGKLYEVPPRNEKNISTFNLTDRTEHRRRRRILNGVFSEAAIRSAEAFVIKHIDRWCELILEKDGEDWTEPINMSKSVHCLVFDIMGDLAFGRSFDIKEPGGNQFTQIPESLVSFAKFVYPLTQSPFLDLWVWLKPRGLNSLLSRVRPESVKQFDDFIDNSVEERAALEMKYQKQPPVKDGSLRKDMFHYLFTARDPETGSPAYSPDELNAEARLLMLAGGETTSTALCSVLFYLTRNLRAHRRVTREVRDTFTSSHEIREGSKLSSCHYLRACIDEAIRMTSPGPGERPRDVLKGGLELDGFFIPEGTRVGASSWSLYHNEKYFGDGWTYRPERWIVDDDLGITPQDVALAQSAFNPFSIGPYNCVGQKLAMQEMLLATAKLLYQMDIKAAPGNSLGGGSPELEWGRRNPNHFHVRDAFVSVKDGPMIQFRRRQSS